MSAPPQIPPRPSRGQNTQSPLNDVPKIPPRPKRAIDRSVSPNRNARSPLNDPAFLHNGPPPKETHLNPDVPARPPSVSLPSLGQEGIEYASLDDLSKTLSNQSEGSPQQTKVAKDLPLYAPTASVPSSTAKSRIQNVTRTDSSQAVAAGFGKLAPEDKPVSSDSGRPSSSAGGNTRPSSIYKDKEEEEHGIPEIGVQVPMYPHAGDVQAPTPSPYESAPSTGIGFFNKGDQPTPRHHGRTKSGREIFHGPPGSYGLHGHGKIGKDEFEQQWYAKHPDDLKREKAGEYGPHIQENRKDYNWESEKLDKLVRAAKGVGMGTSRDAVSTPDEQIGYMASEEYASRMASPRPASSGRPSSIHSKTQPPVESPLRHSKFPEGVLARQETNEGEAEEDVIHIDPPAHRSSKIHGGGYDPPTENLGPEGGNTEQEGGYITERGYGMPILASDEIKKDGPEAEWRQPAIDPELERRTSGEYTVNEDGTPAYITKQRTHSRSSSRNAEKQRFVPSPAQFDRSGTPLESTKEYEPLFPEDEDRPKKPKTPLDKLKRPEFARHQFPSQDTWEDTPSSHQLETTVDTPQGEEEPKTPATGSADASQVFEKPETEQARKENITKEDQQSFLPDHTKRFANKLLEKEHLSTATRPGLHQRFPSQDIWEDSPDQMQLETTVSGPQTPETGEYAEDSPTSTSKPTIPPRPSVPARPQKKDAPVLPERPKPQVPVRPSKPLTKSSEKVPTVSSEEGGEAASPPKAKPPVPARPGGGKIAALQAGFLKDLNSKLGLGPPKVKEPEPEEEEKEPEPVKPLADARKGRAKGPQRRKPTSSPSPAAATVTAEVAVPQQKLALDIVTTVWSIGGDGDLDVPAAKLSAQLHDALKAPGPSKSEEPVAAEEVLDKEEHVETGEADLEPALVKETPPSDPAAAIKNAPEEPDEPIAGQTAGKPDPISAEERDVEPKIENVVPGGGAALEKKQSLEAEIKAETKDLLAAGGGEEAAEKVGATGSSA